MVSQHITDALPGTCRSPEHGWSSPSAEVAPAAALQGSTHCVPAGCRLPLCHLSQGAWLTGTARRLYGEYKQAIMSRVSVIPSRGRRWSLGILVPAEFWTQQESQLGTQWVCCWYFLPSCLSEKWHLLARAALPPEQHLPVRAWEESYSLATISESFLIPTFKLQSANLS